MLFVNLKSGKQIIIAVNLTLFLVLIFIWTLFADFEGRFFKNSVTENSQVFYDVEAKICGRIG